MFAGFTETFLKNGGTAIVIPIYKKGDRNDPDNYRGINLLNIGYKIYSKLLQRD